jgi:predicted nucleotidyltransferase
MGALASILNHKDAILRLAEQYGAQRVRVFGSVARGDDTASSDIDLLVLWGDRTSLTDWVGFQEDVGQLLGRNVDVVSEKSLHWYIRDRVLAEAQPLT